MFYDKRLYLQFHRNFTKLFLTIFVTVILPNVTPSQYLKVVFIKYVSFMHFVPLQYPWNKEYTYFSVINIVAARMWIYAKIPFLPLKIKFFLHISLNFQILNLALWQLTGISLIISYNKNLKLTFFLNTTFCSIYETHNLSCASKMYLQKSIFFLLLKSHNFLLNP